MSAPRSYRVVVIEWLSHEAVIAADSAEAAEAEARRLWAENAETQTFRFKDSGLDGVLAEDIEDDADD